ncbi:MAG: hypothetical protein ACTS6A_00765 [Candidatus Hodgkinia cicadicola]
MLKRNIELPIANVIVTCEMLQTSFATHFENNNHVTTAEGIHAMNYLNIATIIA